MEEVVKPKVEILKGKYDEISDMKDDTFRIILSNFNKYIYTYITTLKRNIEQNLDEIHAHSKKTSSIVKTSLTNEIKKSIKLIPKKDFNVQGVKLLHIQGKHHVYQLEIDHPLAMALEEGTGVYGPNKRPITPRNKKYMFIPDSGYASGGKEMSSYKSRMFKTAIRKSIYYKK